MRKTKAEEVDLIYTKNKKNKKRKRVVEKSKTTTKATKKGQASDNVFNIDDEIIIGITKNENKNKKKSKEKKKDVDGKNKEAKYKKKNKRRSKSFKVAKYTILILIVLGSIISFFLSPAFNIKTVTIQNNSKISKEEILSLSGITIDENLFKIRLWDIERRIKENPYIENVKISRKLPSELIIDIEERIPKFMIEYVNSYVYINNQGYMLEIAESKLELPIITGISTPLEEFKAGNRLQKEDLQKLETVIKIVDSANSYDLGSLITSINIADRSNFILYLETERKTVYLGNASNINTRMMYLKEIVEREKGIESEVFINKDINKDDVYTREKV